jgi:1-acyl-sn-glycerol-3-phosphate acyltransferase
VAITVVVHLAFLPTLVMPRRYAVMAARSWCAGVLWGLKRLAMLDYELRGTLPRSTVLVASKHMTMWDTIAIFHLLGDPVFVLKRTLLRLPFYGWYAQKVGMIGIDRSGGSAALRGMVKACADAMASGLSVVIFPEGTRRHVGAPPDYKPGVAALYQRLDVSCVPVALNSGLYWSGPLGFLKKRGTIVIEFLPAIAPGMGGRAFLHELQSRIETATAELLLARK